jgi:hypothetical protein
MASSEPSSRTIVTTSSRSALRRGTEIEAGVVVLVVDGERVSHGVFTVLVGDAVLARRRMDLQREIVIRNLGRTR